MIYGYLTIQVEHYDLLFFEQGCIELILKKYQQKYEGLLILKDIWLIGC